MNNTTLKTLTAEIAATYEYGKRKAKLEIVKYFNGRKTTLTVCVLNPLPGDDRGDRRPRIEFNSKKAKYFDGVIFGGQGTDWPAENKELEALAKDPKFIAYLQDVLNMPLKF